MQITLNLWPETQSCIGCKKALFINDPMIPDVSYACYDNHKADGNKCKFEIRATQLEWEAKFKSY